MVFSYYYSGNGIFSRLGMMVMVITMTPVVVSQVTITVMVIMTNTEWGIPNRVGLESPCTSWLLEIVTLPLWQRYFRTLSRWRTPAPWKFENVRIPSRMKSTMEPEMLSLLPLALPFMHCFPTRKASLSSYGSPKFQRAPLFLSIFGFIPPENFRSLISACGYGFHQKKRCK